MKFIFKSLAAGIVAVVAGSVSAQAADLQFSHFLPEQFPPNKSEIAFAEALKAATDGTVNVEMVFGGQMGGEKEMLEFVANNVVAMAAFPSNHYIAQFPAYEAFGMSLTYETPEDVARLFKKAVETLPLTKKSYDDENVTPFMFRGLDPYVLLCNKPVRNVGDLKGLKVRTFGSAVPAVFEGLGAVPVNLLTSETYEAMQRGTVDCAYFSRVSHLVFKTYEVSKYYIDFDFGSVSAYLPYINNDVLNEFTDEQKTAFWASAEKGEAVYAQVLAAMEAKAREVFEGSMETMTIEDGHLIREQFSPAWMLNHYVEAMSALGPQQKAVAKEVEAFLKQELGL